MKIKHPQRLPYNQWAGFYAPKDFSPAPTKRFPNKMKSKCGKTFFIDKHDRPYVYETNERGKPAMSYLVLRGWWGQSTIVSPKRVPGGLIEKKISHRR